MGPGLAPIMNHGRLEDVIAKFPYWIDPSGTRLGTYTHGKEQLDYVLMSPAVGSVAVVAGVERRGFYAPETWRPFDSVTKSRKNASDHHCVWVDLKV